MDTCLCRLNNNSPHELEPDRACLFLRSLTCLLFSFLRPRNIILILVLRRLLLVRACDYLQEKVKQAVA